MAARPKVPFALHPSLRLRANLDIAHGNEVALSPDGELAAVICGDWGHRRLEVHTLATGDVTVALSPSANQNYEHLTWSRDGRRWAACYLRQEGNDRRGVVLVGERGREGLLCEAHTPTYGGVTRNSQSRPAPMLVFSRDGEQLVLRTGGDRNVLMHINVADGAVRVHALDPIETDIYAHAFADDGTIYTACADPGEPAGTAWYAPGDDAPAGRLPWAFGLAVLSAPRALWVLGSPRYAFRLAPGSAKKIAPAVPSRLERLAALRARASGNKWDEKYLDLLREWADDDTQVVGYSLGRGSWGPAEAPRPTAGMRCLETDTFWETALAALHGDDAIVTDGVGVWRWHDDGATLVRTLLADDEQRSTHRGARIIGLSVAGDSLALLWKKSARGDKTVLSRFDLGA